MNARKNLIFGLCLGSAILGLLFATYGYVNTWRLWNIPVAMPPFMDVRVITAGAEAHRQGIDPMLSNPTDSSQRRLNYPRIWQGLYRLVVGPGQDIPIGVVSMLLFGTGLVVFVPRISTAGVGLMLAAVFSPAVMLGVERGNTDLLMFFLLALAVAAARRGTILAVALVLFAFVLKLFPLLGLAVVLGKRRGVVIKSFAIAAVLATLYVWFSFDDLRRISAATPRDTWLSYGLNVLWMKVAGADAGAGYWVRISSYALVLAAAGWAGLAGRRAPPEGKAPEGIHLNAFRVGAAFYIGTFLLGNNFVYRFMFLIFAIPQLGEWAGGAAVDRPRMWASRVALIGMYVAMWSMLIDRFLQAWPWGAFFLGEAGAWALFGALVQLLFASGPEWMVQPARKWLTVAAAAAMAPGHPD